MTRGDRFSAGAFIAMIVMDREDNLRINRLGPTEQMFEHEWVCVITPYARELYYDRRTRFGRTATETVDLLQVANVERADSMVSVGSLQEFVSSDAHAVSLFVGE